MKYDITESEAAPYALPAGTPALESSPSLGRRAFLGGALSVGVLGLAASSLLPATGGRPTRDPVQRSRLAWAREVAAGDLEELIEASETWLSVVARHGSREPGLWRGWRRLAQATIDRSSMRDRARRAKLLLHRLDDAPADVRAALEVERRRLQEIVR